MSKQRSLENIKPTIKEIREYIKENPVDFALISLYGWIHWGILTTAVSFILNIICVLLLPLYGIMEYSTGYTLWFIIIGGFSTWGYTNSIMIKNMRKKYDELVTESESSK